MDLVVSGPHIKRKLPTHTKHHTIPSLIFFLTFFFFSLLNYCHGVSQTSAEFGKAMQCISKLGSDVFLEAFQDQVEFRDL